MTQRFGFFDSVNHNRHYNLSYVRYVYEAVAAARGVALEALVLHG